MAPPGPPPTAPTPDGKNFVLNPSSEKDDRLASAIEAKSGKGSEGGDWKARLPERERGALLSARQAKYPESLDPEVKRYFVEIAK